MNNMLRLLERTISAVELEKKKTSSISTFVLSCENVDQLVFHVQNLKAISNDIITDFNFTEADRKKFDLETDMFPIKTIPEVKRKLDIEILYKIMRHAINDHIIVTSGSYIVNFSQYKSLVSDMQSCSLFTFSDTLGNISSEIFYINRWANKWLIKLLLENDQKRIENLFRISLDCGFLKLSKFDKILKVNTMEKTSLKNSSIQFKSILKKKTQTQNELIKLLALFQGIKDYETNPSKVLKFKIQQLVDLISFFYNKRYWYIVFQIAKKLLDIIGHSKEVTLPETWGLEKIKRYARISLLNEAQEYAAEKIERLRYFSLKDLLTNNLVKQEKDWIHNELANIAEKINNQSNIHLPLEH